MAKVMSRVVPIVILIAAVVGWKMYNKGQASEAVRQQASVLLHAFPTYQENRDFFDSAFDELHEKAFDGAYRIGGRRTSSSFDEKQYLTFLVGLFHRKATESGRAGIAEALSEYRKALDLPIVEFPDGATSQ